MISCKKNLVMSIDENLLNSDFWEENPEIVKNMIEDIAIKNEKNELTSVCQKYLSLVDNISSLEKPVDETSNHFLLVLGKSLNNDGSMKETLSDRLECALKLFKKKPNLKIITSGNGEKFGVSEAETMKYWLVNKGVPEKSIFLDSKSSDTMENIVYSTNILIEKKASSVTLVTSEDHIFRAFSLLLIYKENKNLNFTLNKVFSKKSKLDGYFSKNKENFILFKDIGRILNLWEYQKNILPESTPLTNKDNKLKI